MWVVFLLAAMGFAVATLLVIYIGNKVVNAMKKDDAKLDKDINKENTNEKENVAHEQKGISIGSCYSCSSCRRSVYC